MVVYSFLFTFMIFVLIGWASAFWQRGNRRDFYLASQSIGPVAAGLSAVSSTLSGFLFIGIIGMTWKLGLFAVFLFFSIMFGNFANWLFLVPRLRKTWDASPKKLISFAEFVLQPTNKNKSDIQTDPIWSGYLKVLVAIITIVFLSTYSAGQINSAGKALQVLFGWELWSGALLGSVVVLIYCIAGGLRATIWTDTAQSVVMFVAMGVMVALCYQMVGGFTGLYSGLHAIDPKLVSFIPEDNRAIRIIAGFGMFIMGLGVIGQPHIMVRAIALKDQANIGKFRNIYFSYYFIFCAMALFVGLCCRLLIRAEAGFDPELALPSLANENLPQILTGIVLAGVFSSTMSTADSQILSISTTIMQDLLPQKFRDQFWITKATTVCVIAGVLLISLFATGSVGELILFSWAGLAVTLGALVILRVFQFPVEPKQAILMILSAMTTSFLWMHFGLNRVCSEVLPGIIVGTLVYWIYHLLIIRPRNHYVVTNLEPNTNEAN